MKYRKKPVVIEAIQYNGMNGNKIIKWSERNVSSDEGNLYVNTLEGLMRISFGDYIIKGVKGEFYPCKPDIFEATYEGVSEE